MPLRGPLSGIGMYVKYLVRALLESEYQAHWKFPVASTRSKGWVLRDVAKHVPLDAIATDYRWVPGADLIGLLWNLPFFSKVDLYHMTNVRTQFSTHRTPTVVTAHDITWLRLSSDLCPKPPICGIDQLPSLLKSARVVVCDSHATLNDVAEILGIPESRLFHVPLAGRPEFQPPADAAERELARRELVAGNRYFLAIGTIEPRKNYPRLVQAFAKLRRQGCDHHLVIVGRKGWGWESVREAIERTGMQAFVHVAGYLDEVAVLRSLWGADALVMPSLYEGFGLPVLEAMACGTPVIAAGAGSLPEVVDKAALIVDPLEVDSICEGMAQMIDQVRRSDEWRERGIAQSAKFTWEETARKTWEAYQVALS